MIRIELMAWQGVKGAEILTPRKDSISRIMSETEIFLFNRYSQIKKNINKMQNKEQN